MKERKWGFLLSLTLLVGLLSGCTGKDVTDSAQDGGYQKIELVMAVNGTDIQIDSLVAYKFAELVEAESGGAYYAGRLAQKGITYLGSFHNGFRQLTNSKRAVKTPEDLKGLKIRVPGSEVYMNVFREFKADPVAMSWSEVFTAIQQGTIDGQENGVSITNSAKMNEIQDYMTLWKYTYENDLFVANTKIWESLEAKTRELLQEKAKEACNWGRDAVEQEEDELIQKFRNDGMEVTELTEEELQAFKDVVGNVRQKFIDKYGEEACEAFQID